MKIIGADARLAEKRGAEILIVRAQPVSARPRLLRTLMASTTLFIDVEAGDLAVQNLPVPHYSY